MCFFFFNDTATTEIYTLSLHDALPISRQLDTAPDRYGPHAQPARLGGHSGCRMNLDLPHDLKATDPRFIETLNDRLRRLTSGSGATTVTASASSGPSTLILSVPGTLGIASDVAPSVSMATARTCSGFVALVKQAPTGADLEVSILV